MKNNIIKYSLFILPFSLLMSCHTNKNEVSNTSEIDIPKVRTTTVKLVNYSDQINTTGRLAFNNEYKMSFKTAGIIEGIYVTEGQTVIAGQTIASLNPNEIEAATSQTQITVNKAQRDYDRAEALYTDSVVTLEQLQNSESQLKTAQHNLRIAKFNLNQSKIIAPTNGIIQKILGKQNEITGAGTPVIIFGAIDQGKVLVTNISDVDVVKIELGDKAILHFDAWYETTFKGKVLGIEGMANSKTGTYEIKIQVNDLNNQLKPGFIGSATITSSIVNEWIEIPIESLVQANKKTGVVYKFNSELAIKQEVNISKILNNKLLISSGLSDNDKVIIEGFGQLKGDSISVKSTH
jgi:multidrug efflux system membrane fusion protein